MHRGIAWLVLCACLFLPVASARVLLLGVSSARAETVEARARAHFDAGRALHKLGNYEGAIREFAAGYQLSPRPEFVLNLGQCYRRLDDLGHARDMFLRYLETAPSQDPLRAQVTMLLRELDAELARRAAAVQATAVASPPPASAPPQASPPAPAPVPDLHTMPESQSVVPRTPEALVESRPGPRADAAATKAGLGRRYLGGWVGLGSSVGLGIVGLGLSLSTSQRHGELLNSCGATPQGCSASDRTGLDRLALASDVMVALTGAATITTIVLFAVEAHAQRRSARPSSAHGDEALVSHAPRD